MSSFIDGAFTTCAYLTSVVFVVSLIASSAANHDEKRLYDDLLRKSQYEKHLRPVANWSDKVLVKFGLRLSQILDVDERNEIISLNMWVLHQWYDYKLQWDPRAYGSVDVLYVPAESIWRPDIVLYNNADGDYTVTLLSTKATVESTGLITWRPPAIFKCYCNINVKFFPFDEQECNLKFGSWSYSGEEVDMQHMLLDIQGHTDQLASIADAIDIHGLFENKEWDIMQVVAKKNEIFYPCCVNTPFPDITFNITLRRKPLFYTINLIIPCVALNMLTILAFYLPVNSREKISLCISILLSLSLFQLLLMELIPSTSITMPLLGTYILFTNFVISISVFWSVVVLNIHYRSSSGMLMPRCARKIFLHLLPSLLFMKRPKVYDTSSYLKMDLDNVHCDLSNYENPYKKKFQRIHTDPESLASQESLLINENNSNHIRSDFIGFSRENLLGNHNETAFTRKGPKLPPNLVKAMEGIIFVAKHSRNDEQKSKISNEWMYFAMVVDRILMYIYLASCVAGALGILLNAPVLYDNSLPLCTGAHKSSHKCQEQRRWW